MGVHTARPALVGPSRVKPPRRGGAGRQHIRGQSGKRVVRSDGYFADKRLPPCFLREEQGRMKVSHGLLNFKPNFSRRPLPAPPPAGPGQHTGYWSDSAPWVCAEVRQMGATRAVRRGRVRALNLKPWVMGSHAGTCLVGCLRAGSC